MTATNPTTDAPNHAYYRACEGRWRAPLALAITDWHAFRTSGLSLADRWRILSMVIAARVVGPFSLETSVDATTGAARHEVVHTTRIAKWGLTLMRSTEWLTLDPNGRDVAMRGEFRLVPTLWRPRPMPAVPARVDETASRASYRFAWLGTEMRQEAERSPDGTTVTLIQLTPFSRGVQVLRRQ
jgi:hypothetical protein